MLYNVQLFIEILGVNVVCKWCCNMNHVSSFRVGTMAGIRRARLYFAADLLILTAPQ